MKRVIDQLRHIYPDGSWSYDIRSGSWTNGTRTVRAYAALVDEDTFVTHYRWETGELVVGLGWPSLFTST